MKKIPMTATREFKRVGNGDDYNGTAQYKTPSGMLVINFSNTGGWDHVVVSRYNRTPSWFDMVLVRQRFFEPSEVVLQIHLPEGFKRYHPHCLHLWRWQKEELPLPPPDLIHG